MHTCENCGEESYRTHGGWSNALDGWYCGECLAELREEE
jgi:hypothetical protein